MSDSELNKSQRLVRLLELLHRPGGVNANEVIHRFSVDARTLRRYISDLRDVGVPINEDDAGDDRILSVDASYGRSGVHLTLAEVLSLHFGRTLYTFLEGTSFAADMEGAIERLSPAISRFAQDITRDLDRKFLAVAEHNKDYAGDGDLIDEIVSALLYGNPADAEYRSAKGASKIYRLEPLTLATYRQGLYLFARDLGARDGGEGKIKSFAIERFLRFSRLRREHFGYPTDYHPRQVVGQSFGITSGPAEEVVAVFTPEVSLYVRERTWHKGQKVELLGDGSVRLRLRVNVGPELRQWFLSFGADVRVDEPPSLAAWQKEAHLSAAARYK